jgi:hypothetical protein
MKIINRGKTRWRFLPLSIPDLIRDPGGKSVWIPAFAGMVISDIFKVIFHSALRYPTMKMQAIVHSEVRYSPAAAT